MITTGHKLNMPVTITQENFYLTDDIPIQELWQGTTTGNVLFSTDPEVILQIVGQNSYTQEIDESTVYLMAMLFGG